MKELIDQDFLKWLMSECEETAYRISCLEIKYRAINSLPSDEGVTLAENEAKEEDCSCRAPLGGTVTLCIKCSRLLAGSC